MSFKIFNKPTLSPADKAQRTEELSGSAKPNNMQASAAYGHLTKSDEVFQQFLESKDREKRTACTADPLPSTLDWDESENTVFCPDSHSLDFAAELIRHGALQKDCDNSNPASNPYTRDLFTEFREKHRNGQKEVPQSKEEEYANHISKPAMAVHAEPLEQPASINHSTNHRSPPVEDLKWCKLKDIKVDPKDEGLPIVFLPDPNKSLLKSFFAGFTSIFSWLYKNLTT